MKKEEYFESTCYSPFRDDHQKFFNNLYCNFSFPKHFHDEFLIQVISRGQNSFYCNGQTFSARAGDVVLINPGEIHNGTCHPNDPLEYKVFYVDQNNWASLFPDDEAGFNPSSLLFNQTVARDIPLHNRICDFYYKLEQGEKDEHYLWQNYADILTHIRQHYLIERIRNSANDRYHKKTVDTLKEYIHENLDSDLTLQTLSRISAVSPFHLLRLFTKYTGLTLHQFIIVRKIERAKSLLIKRPIGDVAYTLGFADHGHFTRSFKKMSGQTPSEFQKSSKAAIFQFG